MAKKEPYVEFYKDVNKKWRWRAWSANKKKVADCAEAYNSKASAIKGGNAAADALAGVWQFPKK